jgi:hypothetical protein
MKCPFLSPAFVAFSCCALLACGSPTPSPSRQSERPDAKADALSVDGRMTTAPADASTTRRDGSGPDAAAPRLDAAADRNNDRAADLAPTCSPACSADQSCVGGRCTCAAGKTACNRDCADLQTDDNHCGDCATMCSGGTDCQAGKCVCPNGQTLCDGACVDTSASANHCGRCTNACDSGQTCTNGTCAGQGSTSTPNDGCTDTLASNITLKQIAVYQTVKIPVMTDMKEVAASSRTADVVAGRDAMLRVFVTVGSGWTSRSLSARLTLTVDGTSKSFFSKQTIAASSAEGTLPNSFPIQVPASALADGAHYSVRVVECGTASGSAGQARFPTSGDLDLGVRVTGGLKIKIIPITVGSLTPDTSATALDVYSKTMRAMYPINAIDISVGGSITTDSPIDWVKMVDQVRAKRQADAPASDVYYFGLVKPASTLAAYCGSACTTGIGYVVLSANTASQRAAVGVGFADRYSAETMAHEVGHNHGRNHAPCVSGGGSIDGVDPNYPYTKGALGSWGYDPRTQALIDPSRSTDIMAYCSNKWMSDYTYHGITDRVAAINGQALMLVSPAALNRWRVLLVDGQGPRWGISIDQETLGEGAPEQATVYDRSGAALDTITVYRTEISDINAASIMVPEPKSNWYAVQVAGAPPYPFAAP